MEFGIQPQEAIFNLLRSLQLTSPSQSVTVTTNQTTTHDETLTKTIKSPNHATTMAIVALEPQCPT